MRGGEGEHSLQGILSPPFFYPDTDGKEEGTDGASCLCHKH